MIAPWEQWETIGLWELIISMQYHAVPAVGATCNQKSWPQ